MSSNDTLIVGAGLTGLFLAHRLHLAGRSVTLLEAKESLGGRYRRPSQALPYASPGLNFIPAATEHLAVLEWLKNQAPMPMHYSVTEHHPQIFVDGHWKPFAGFGESSFQSVGELSALFGHVQQIHLQPGLEQLTRALVEQLPFAAQTMSEVTGFTMADGRINEVVINGNKTLKAETIIFTPHPLQLNSLFQGEDLPVKHRTRLAKAEAWTAVTLDLTHAADLTTDQSIRIFTHSAKDFEPVVGRVTGDHSKWMTLVPMERETDHEFIGQCIRHIKRQLKRAWPEAFADADKSQAERIYVLPLAYGQYSLRTKDAFRFPEIANLYLGGHALAGLHGELGALEIAHALEVELCGPLNRLPELGASC